MGAEEKALGDKSVDLNILQILRVHANRANADEQEQRQPPRHKTSSSQHICQTCRQFFAVTLI